MPILSTHEQNRMSKANELRDLICGDYIYSLENDNTKYILQRFFDNQQYVKPPQQVEGVNMRTANKKGLLTETLRVMNVGSGLFSTIATVIANYVGNPELGETSLDISEQVQDLEATGYCVFTVSREAEKVKVNYVPSYNYSEETGEPRVIRIYETEDDKGHETYYAFVRTYLPGAIKNELFELEDEENLKTGRLVPLTTIPQTSKFTDIEQTGLSMPSIFKVQIGYEEYGQSEFKKVMSIIYSIERKMVMFENEFLRNVESFVIFKGIRIPDYAIDQITGKADIAKLGKYLSTQDDAGTIEFVQNQNDLIKDAIEYVDKQLKQISAITSIPPEFLALETSEGAIGKGSRSLKHGAFIKKIESIRGTLTEAFEQYLFPMLAELGEDVNGVVWSDVFAKSDNDLVEELKIARESGLISQERAVGLYLGIDDDEAKQEVLLINSSTNDVSGDKNPQVPNGNGTANDQETPQ